MDDNYEWIKPLNAALAAVRPEFEARVQWLRERGVGVVTWGVGLYGSPWPVALVRPDTRGRILAVGYLAFRRFDPGLPGEPAHYIISLTDMPKPTPEQDAVLRDWQHVPECPVEANWRSWILRGTRPANVPSPSSHLDLDALGDPLLPLPFTWELAPDDAALSPSDDPGFYPGSPGHRHMEVAISGHLVHIDELRLSRRSPGRGMAVRRVYVDRELVAEGSLREALYAPIGATRVLELKPDDLMLYRRA